MKRGLRLLPVPVASRDLVIASMSVKGSKRSTATHLPYRLRKVTVTSTATELTVREHDNQQIWHSATSSARFFR